MVGERIREAVLVTCDLDLADAVISEYAGKITGEQVERHKVQGWIVYLFKNLDLRDAESFLRIHKSDKYMIVT